MERVTLAPGESKTVTVAIDLRVLQDFNEVDNSWNLAQANMEYSSAHPPIRRPSQKVSCFHEVLPYPAQQEQRMSIMQFGPTLFGYRHTSS